MAAVAALFVFISAGILNTGRAVPAFIPDESAWANLESMAANVSQNVQNVQNVHYITVATKPKYGLECLRATAEWQGMNVEALGFGDSRFTQWGKGFGVKLEMAQKKFERLPRDDLVVFTDAYDVLAAAPADAIRAAFVRAVARAMIMEPRDPSGKQRIPSIVFSTEIFCWPDDDKADAYPEIDKRAVFPYLNSGTYIGRVGDLLALMEEETYDPSTDDQRYFTSLYFKSRKNPRLPRVILDHYSDVFLCTNGFTVGKDIVFDPALRHWKHTQTPGIPTIIHFNGNSKWNIPGFFDMMQGNSCYMCPWWATVVGQSVIAAGVMVASWLLGATARACGLTGLKG